MAEVVMISGATTTVEPSEESFWELPFADPTADDLFATSPEVSIRLRERRERRAVQRLKMESMKAKKRRLKHMVLRPPICEICTMTFITPVAGVPCRPRERPPRRQVEVQEQPEDSPFLDAMDMDHNKDEDEDEDEDEEDYVHRDECDQAFVLDAYRTPNGDTLRTKRCCHAYCTGCVQRYLSIEVQDKRRSGFMRCPAPECDNMMFPMDVVKVLQKQTPSGLTRDLCDLVKERYNTLLLEDYTTRLTDLLDSADAETQLMLFQCSRVCPQCKVVLSKNGGCPDFFCSCGHNFTYGDANRPMYEGWKGSTKSYRAVLEEAVKSKREVTQVIQEFVALGLDVRNATKRRCNKQLEKYESLLLCTEPELTREEAARLAELVVRGDKSAIERVQVARKARRTTQLDWQNMTATVSADGL